MGFAAIAVEFPDGVSHAVEYNLYPPHSNAIIQNETPHSGKVNIWTTRKRSSGSFPRQ